MIGWLPLVYHWFDILNGLVEKSNMRLIDTRRRKYVNESVYKWQLEQAYRLKTMVDCNYRHCGAMSNRYVVVNNNNRARMQFYCKWFIHIASIQKKMYKMSGFLCCFLCLILFSFILRWIVVFFSWSEQ